MEKTWTILMVDDNKINQILTKKMIDKVGGLCTLVENGYDAIDLLKTTTFDIILMDISMPMIDGYETSKMIRELGIKTPIIAITAYGRAEVEKKSHENGITAIITKPFTSEILFEEFEKVER